MFVAVIAVLPSPADAQELRLDAVGRYRGFWQAVEPGELPQSDQAFSETLAAALEGVVVERAIATYHLGFALNNDVTMSPYGRSNQFGWTYDLRADVRPRGPTPVSAYALRRTFGFAQGAGPGYRLQSDLAGYTAAFTPKGMPSLSSSGFTETRRTESDDEVRVERLSALTGRLSHQQGRLLALGGLELRRDADLSANRTRDQTQGDLYADYRVQKDVKIVAYSRVRTVDAAFGGGHSLVGAEDSSVAVDWRPGPKTAALVQYRLDRTRTLSDTLSSANGSARVQWFPSGAVSSTAEAGVGGTWYRPGDLTVDPTQYAAQYARVAADWSRGGDFPLRLGADAGAAVVSEPGEGVGVQDGGAVSGSAGGRFAGGRVLVSTNGRLARQWDTSTQDASYFAVEGGVTVIAAGLGPFDVNFFAVTNTVQALSTEMASSDRFRASSQVNWHPSSQVAGGGGIIVYRDVVDQEFSSGVGYSAYLRAAPAHAWRVEARYSTRVMDTSVIDDVLTTQLNGSIGYRFAGFDLSGRVDHSRTGVLSEPARTTVVWAEVSRRFSWDL